MKRLIKVFLAISASILLSAAFSAVSSAESYSVIPGSDRVVFIKDLPDGYSGRGTGASAADPFVPDPDPEGFDPDANVPKYHLTTAFYQALEQLSTTGGTIVICGEVRLNNKNTYGNGANTKYFFTPLFKKPIKFTSVYNGVDYRKTANARIVLDEGAEIGVNGESVWENITIVTGSSDRLIAFNNYRTVVGSGVICRPESEDFERVNTYYVSLSAGHRYNRLIGTPSEPKETHLIVRSGTYNKIVGGAWGTTVGGAVWADKDGDEEAQERFYKFAYVYVNCYLTLEGTTEVLGEVCGTIPKTQFFGGNAYIEINGGRYECDINGAGPTSFINSNATLRIVVSGGDFYDCYSLNTIALNPKGYYPAHVVLDLSNFPSREVGSLSALYNVITDFELKDIVFPSWWTGPVDDYPPETTVYVTETAEPEPQTEPATAAPEPQTEPARTETERPETGKPIEISTEGPKNQDDTDLGKGYGQNGTDPEGSDTVSGPEGTGEDVSGGGKNNRTEDLPLLILIICAAFVVLIIVVVVILLIVKKKKESMTEETRSSGNDTDTMSKKQQTHIYTGQPTGTNASSGQSPASSFCPACGKQIPASVRFCPFCGSKRV